MRFAFLAITFFLSSTIEVSISYATTRPSAAVPAAPRIKMKDAVTAWKRLMTCQNLALKNDQSAAYNRCLDSAMPPQADRFDQMKVTEFLLLEIPVKALGRCPRSLEPIQKLRKPAGGMKAAYACFVVSFNAEGSNSPMGGEIEFAQTKNGELKVRRIRYSY